MEQTEAQKWAETFENKSLEELRAMEPPEELDQPTELEWSRARVRAIYVIRDAQELAEKRAAQKVRQDAQIDAPREAIVNLLKARATQLQEEAEAQKLEFNSEERSEVVEKLVLPPGDAAQLLEHQLATSAGLIDHLAKYIVRNDTSPDVCVNFMDRMSAMIGKSAQAGKVIGQLRGHVSRSRQEIAVSHAGGGRGAG